MNDKRSGKLLLMRAIDKIGILFENIVRRNSAIDQRSQSEMSLIGPRPLLPQYLFYNEFQNRATKLAGITGWAQVNGRNAISWDKKFEYDVWYVDHLSFGWI
jgi:hypothetical protein